MSLICQNFLSGFHSPVSLHFLGKLVWYFSAEFLVVCFALVADSDAETLSRVSGISPSLLWEAFLFAASSCWKAFLLSASSFR